MQTLIMEGLQEIKIKDYPLSPIEKRDFQITYQLFGQPLHQAPVVLINHALTGNSEVGGENGWWKSLVGEKQIIDLHRYTVLCFDIPGNGYNGNEAQLIYDYKKFSTRIIADLFWSALDKLKINELYAVIGSSLGGGIAWEMAFLRKHGIKHLIPVATSLKASDWLIGNTLVQDRILNNSDNPIEDARMHAMHLYRTPTSFGLKFKGEIREEEDQYEVESWLKYHGRTLNKRFQLASYKLMNHLLKTIGETVTKEELLDFAKESTAHIHSIAVDSDYLFTRDEQFEAYQFLKKNGATIDYAEISSVHGHDAFLIEYGQLNKLLQPIF